MVLYLLSITWYIMILRDLLCGTIRNTSTCSCGVALASLAQLLVLFELAHFARSVYG